MSQFDDPQDPTEKVEPKLSEQLTEEISLELLERISGGAMSYHSES